LQISILWGVAAVAVLGQGIAMRIALYQPEIPGNVGAILRLSACLGVAVDIIEPTGFVWSDARLKRAAMDYLDHVTLARHADWSAFQRQVAGRVVLLSSKAAVRLPDFAFEPNDVLLMGQESAGVPDDVRAACDAAVRIPLNPAVRSLNVAVAAGIALGEAVRQTDAWPS
jgi:tRNA (cytidine/uridine-2'-O-)-methyltransferase